MSWASGRLARRALPFGGYILPRNQCCRPSFVQESNKRGTISYFHVVILQSCKKVETLLQRIPSVAPLLSKTGVSFYTLYNLEEQTLRL